MLKCRVRMNLTWTRNFIMDKILQSCMSINFRKYKSFLFPIMQFLPSILRILATEQSLIFSQSISKNAIAHVVSIVNIPLVLRYWRKVITSLSFDMCFMSLIPEKRSISKIISLSFPLSIDRDFNLY